MIVETHVLKVKIGRAKWRPVASFDCEGEFDHACIDAEIMAAKVECINNCRKSGTARPLFRVEVRKFKQEVDDAAA